MHMTGTLLIMRMTGAALTKPESMILVSKTGNKTSKHWGIGRGRGGRRSPLWPARNVGEHHI